MSSTAGKEPTDPLLTIDDAANYLAIPKATLYTWRTRRAGFGPKAIKMGGCLRFRRSDLDDWILAHQEAVVASPPQTRACPPSRSSSRQVTRLRTSRFSPTRPADDPGIRVPVWQ